MAAPFRIRDGRLPADEAIMIGFIDALQAFEHGFERNRRVDPRAGADYLPNLLERVKANSGSIFIAEAGGRAVGWAVFHTSENAIYVVPDERRYGYIAELFVEEKFRGHGIGRALIATCEQAARTADLKVLMIGVLAANSRARAVYEAAGFAPYALELRRYL